MGISNFTNKMSLHIGSMNGLDVAMSGMAAGAGFGAIGGIASDHDTMLSGAIKGGMIGAPLGMGVKYVGSRYSKGFLSSHGAEGFNKALKGDSGFGWNTDYFTNGSFGAKESFMNRFGGV